MAVNPTNAGATVSLEPETMATPIWSDVNRQIHWGDFGGTLASTDG
jgi:hypothetical protein